MGLLNKALILDEKVAYSPDIKNMVNILELEQKGLDFPSLLFSHIKKDFQIKKGALLLKESDTHFVPWAETGFDKTTSRRIRIPKELLKNIENCKSFDFLRLTGSDLIIMKNFFSFREFSITNEIIISPIFFNNEIIAILFVCEGEVLSNSNIRIKELLENLSIKAGPLLFKKRETILNKLKAAPDTNENYEILLSNYIEDKKNKEFTIILLELSNFINNIKRIDSDSISFRIKQDITRLVHTLIFEKGRVIDASGNKLIILLEGSRLTEAELFVHQIGLSIGHFYKQNVENLKPSYSIRQYPNDGTTCEELLDF